MGAGPEKEKMRKAFVTAAAGVALLTLAACNRNEEAAEAPAEAPAATAPAPAAGETAAAPQRRPGLWEQRVSTEGMVQVSRICIDEALEKRIGWWGQQATAGRAGHVPLAQGRAGRVGRAAAVAAAAAAAAAPPGPQAAV